MTLSLRKNGQSPRCDTSAFTLIELLIVIGVIAILISIPIPTVKHISRTSDRLKCAANIRSCNQALYLYANDNNGYLPYLPDPNGPVNTYMDFGGKSGTQSDRINRKKKLINPYLTRAFNTNVTEEKIQDIYRCPADSGAEVTWKLNNGTTVSVIMPCIAAVAVPIFLSE